MNNVSVLNSPQTTRWEADVEAFKIWLANREDMLQPGLTPDPTIKVLVFLALLDTNKACSYEEIREIFKAKSVIKGTLSDNTLRVSVLNLGKTLEKAQHHLELKSFRGRFQLISRTVKQTSDGPAKRILDPVIILLDPPAINAEEIAYDLIEKATLPYHALYFLEWSARWWEIFSSSETEIRVPYETSAWEKLGIRDRLINETDKLIGFVSLAPGEGLAEIGLLKKILHENKNKKIHYLAIDSSQKLLRDHISLLKELLISEIDNGRLICVGVIADIFSGLREATNRVRNELYVRGITKIEQEFLPSTCGLLITYLGNCLGNNYQDQESEIFSTVHSTFKNRPLEFLIGVSVMRSSPDEYKRNWDDFLLQTPKHLLETKKLLESVRPNDSASIPEFNLPKTGDSNRCPPVIPEYYIVRHKIEGQIYRFYYRLAYDIRLAAELCDDDDQRPNLTSGTLILLYNIIKYNIKSLVSGIEKCGLFKTIYNENYHQIVDTPNGKREYAVFVAYLDK